MGQSTNWDDYRLVSAIAETGSLGGAADLLALNHSTVFRRLGALEEQIGVRLFERARAGYAATAAGEEMIRIAKRMGAEILDFERKVAGRDVKPSGDLRITTNDTMVCYLATPVFAGFRELYPDIRLEIIVGNLALNLARRDADIALRATDDPPETLVGRRIAAIHWACYGSRPLLDRWPTCDDPGAPWISYGEPLASVPAVRHIHETIAAGRIVYRTSTVIGQAEAVAAGIGFAFIPCFVADQFRELIRLTPSSPNHGRSLWLLTHPDLRQSARVRAFMDYAGTELAKKRKMLEGAQP